ncbi:MAG: DUF885 domain-containing protein [Chitinophagaceae bacterium]|nr:DUF885 domain-containing protein [Chitinophagaceae bacterium]
MLKNYYEAYIQLNPTTASYRGDYRYNDQLENSISQPYRDQSKFLYSRFLDSLKYFSLQELSARDQLSYRIFEYHLKNSIKELELTSYLVPISQMRDFRISFSQMGSGSSVHPFKTVKDYDDFLKRINAFVVVTDTAIENMRKGMAIGKVQPRVLIEKVVPQIKAMQVDDVTKSIFYNPIKNIPADFSAEDKRRLTMAYSNAISQQLKQAYNRLLSFIENEYLPKTRETFGLMAQPNGKTEYAFLVKSWTTTNLTPDEVFEVGEKEVKRIGKEMENIKKEVGFKGTLKEFFNYVATDPKFFPFKKDEDVTAGFQQIYERIKPHLAKQFNIVPKTAFEIRPIEKYRAATTAANYMGGTPDGSRAGVFYFPVLDATKYSYWRMEDLFLHEAIPGHHYQISLQTENKNIPDMQKVGRYGAYVEGWGLYAESMGKELGLYTDPYQRLGQLQGEMHRAIRLVVDVGIHHHGWSRDKAIQYSLENEPVTKENATQEIERYISMPGQALSYKIGELKILEMRHKAEKVLGKRFDVRAFHDEVLKDGAMPLQIFEAKINAWIEKQAGI